MTPATASRLGLLLVTLCVSPLRADDFYVSVMDLTGGDGAILKVDDSGMVTPFLVGFDRPSGLAFDSNHNLFVLDQDIIYKVDSSGVKTALVTDPNLVGGIGSGLAIDSQGNIYAPGRSGSQGFSSINKYDSSGAFVSYWATGSSLASGLTFDQSGNLIAGVQFANTVVSFAPNGTSTVLLNEQAVLQNPYSVAFNAAGQLFVTGNDGNAYSLTSTGDLVPYASVIGCDCTDAIGIAFDSTGKMFMANADSDGDDNSITVTSADGTSTSIFVTLSDTQYPNYIAIEPAVVPEPSTAGVLFLGLGVLGILARRRFAQPL